MQYFYKIFEFYDSQEILHFICVYIIVPYHILFLIGFCMHNKLMKVLYSLIGLLCFSLQAQKIELSQQYAKLSEQSPFVFFDLDVTQDELDFLQSLTIHAMYEHEEI